MAKIRTISSLINDIYRAGGIEPSVLTLTPSQLSRALVMVNVEIPNIWESEWWPDIMLVEKRTVATGPLIDFCTSGQTEIGGIDSENGISIENPLYNPAAQRIKCNVQAGVIYFGDGMTVAGDEVWLKFRPPAPEYSLTAWSNATAYSVGDLVWLSSTGHTYRCIQGGTNKAPATETTYWVVVGVPQAFYNYLVLRVSAYRMREEDGQGAQYNRAREELERVQGSVIDGQERGSRRAIVRM